MKTITNGTEVYELPEGLELFAARDNTARCCDCGRWADAGDKIRHGSRCDTDNLQPLLGWAHRPKPRFHRTKSGKLVVLGLVADVFAGAEVTIADENVPIATCGKSWTTDGLEFVYGYLAETDARRECLECGAVEGLDTDRIEGHGMGCSQCK